MADRQFDIVIFGATGFTGGLVAQYLAQVSASQPLRWALAGRNEVKLAGVRKELNLKDGQVAPELLIADVNDSDSLKKLVEVTKVVITTVGPYDKYGEPLVKACAVAGTHYVDLTGEPQFSSRMRERYHDLAQLNGARIVPSCGFESVPPDIGTLFAIKELRSRVGVNAWEHAAVTVRCGIEVSGRISGGTWHSAVEAMSQAPKWMRNRPKLPAGNVSPVKPIPYREKRIDRWAIPIFTIDPEVVCHSALERKDYGRRFQYGHYHFGKSLLPVAAGLVGLSGVFTLAQFEPTKQWLLKLKKSGDGPTEAQRANGWFRISFIAEAAGKTAVTQVSGGDPFYGDTAKMLAESALCLALDSNLPDAAGVLTPASGIGEALIPRLEKAGIQFSVIA